MVAVATASRATQGCPSVSLKQVQHHSASWRICTTGTIPYSRILLMEPRDDLVVVSPTKPYEIKAFRTDGSLARILRRDHAPRSPTPADLEPYIQHELSHFRHPPEGFRESARRMLESLPMAETFPAFSSIIADALGYLWVEEYEFPGEERDGVLWTVFDPEGRVMGFVETPEGVRVFEIGADYLLGTVRDELGVEYVRVWGLGRA